MSLLGSRLGAAIWTAVKATQSYSPAITPAQDAQGLAVWTAVANEIVTEITTNAVVPATGLIDGNSLPVTGSTTVT